MKIRIAVAVDPKGRWYAHGSGDGDKVYPKNHDELLEVVDLDQCGPSEALYWVEVDLPVPQVKTVAAAEVELVSQ